MFSSFWFAQCIIAGSLKITTDTLSDRLFGPETICSTRLWKTLLQIGHVLGKGMDHQQGAASSRKLQLGDTMASFQGQWFSLGHQRENQELWPLTIELIHAVTMQTCIMRGWEWAQPDISPCLVFGVLWDTPAHHGPVSRLPVPSILLSFQWYNIQVPQLLGIHSVPLLTLGNIYLFPS